ncbi:RNB domain-containing ribonuclease [Patulibacter defluvii]|uniref:RNB domain-containing ribonuclease n=1 Tax=Patulibacter defluvii TaxID=3095358 RepID=UPI002A74E860|nr:RNB domain-containing ribonuclease [Patulibacter sp. DM4]
MSSGTAALPRDVWRDSGHGPPPTVGVVRRRGRFLVAEPLFDRGAPVVVDRSAEIREGRIGLFAPPGGRRGRGSGGKRGRDARLLRDVGTPDVARDVLEALLLHHGLPRRIPRSVATEAEAVAAGGPTGEERIVRRDLRGLPTFTIDPVTARDFDDAISAEEIDAAAERFRVVVHIADVAAHVRPGGALDADARWRGTSVYVPGTVEPMLPPALSNDACSLVPGVDRLAVSVELELRAGEVVAARVDRTLIHSDARLDYDQVDRIFAGREQAEDPWAAPLAIARRVAAALQRRREQTTTALELDTGEPQFRFDGGGHVDAIAVERQTEAHRLIEHLMIAANEQVARLLDEARVPALHRVHDRPDPAAVRRLADQLAVLGVALPPLGGRDGDRDAPLGPEQAAAAVAEISRRVDEHVRRQGHGRAGLSYLVLRALQQARYDPRGTGHAGLGLRHYCHFTSPIRRYPDLVCHRAILSLIGAGEDAPSPDGLGELATWCSATERDAMEVERTADRIARAFLLERLLFAHGFDHRFAGEVTGVAAAGAFVRFGAEQLGAGGSDAEAFEGLLPVRLMAQDWWELDELGVMLVGTRSGATLRIGDPVTVAVDRVEPVRGRVTLVPAR